MRFKLNCKIFFILLVCLTSLNVFAGLRCDLLKNLENSALTNNAKFWEEYSDLSSKKNLNDRTLSDLFKKHNAEPVIHEAKPISTSSTNELISYSTSKRADKEISKLSKSLRKNYEEFMGIMNDRGGIKTLYDNPGKWRMEKIDQFKNTYTVRLNGGVRILFKLEKNELTVLEVNAAHIHAL